MGAVRGGMDVRLAAAVVDPAPAATGRRPAVDRRRRAGPRRSRRPPPPPRPARRAAPSGRRAGRRRRPLERRHGRGRRGARRGRRRRPGPAGRLDRQAARLLDRRHGDDRRRRSCSSTPTCRPGPALLDGLAAAVAAAPDAVVSVQPWHDAERLTERATCLADVVALMGSGAFTVLGRRLPAGVAFGPVLALSPRTPTSGPAATPTRTSGRASSRTSPSPAASGAATCSPAATDATSRRPRRCGRRSPAWSRTMAFGIAATRWWVALAVVAWVCLARRRAVRRAGRPTRSARRRCWCSAGGPGASGRSPRWRTRSPSSCSSSIVARAGWQRARGTTTWKGRRV